MGLALVTAATVFWSTAGLFVRALDLDVWTIAGWRSFFAGCALLLVVAVRDGRRLPGAVAGLGWPGLLAVAMSGISMFTYVAALKLTSVANVLTVYATVPFMAAGLAFVWSGERASRRVVWASAAALCGILVVVGGAVTPRDLAGNALSMLMTATFAIVLVMMRRYPALNVALVNSLAAFCCATACALLVGVDLPGGKQLAIVGVFGFVTTALAYLMFLTGGRYIPSGEAGLIGLLDVVLGPLWVWLAFAERPSGGALAGAAVVLAAVAWYIAGEVWRPTGARLA